MTFDKQKLEDAFDDLGWYDLLSHNPYTTGCSKLNIQFDVMSDEDVIELFGNKDLVEEGKKLAHHSLAGSIVGSIIKRSLDNKQTWNRKLSVPNNVSCSSKVIEFIDLIYQGTFSTKNVLLCSPDLFTIIQIHPKATTGVRNTFHVFGNRIIRVHVGLPLRTGLLIPKEVICIKESLLPEVNCEVLEIPETRLFTLEGDI